MLWILTKDLPLCLFTIQLIQELKPEDHLICRAFVDWVLQKQEVILLQFVKDMTCTGETQR